jgi:parvulin-like peptidyl-prolyl isomerase
MKEENMYKSFIAVFILLFIFACSPKEEGIQLEKDSDEYNFAKELSVKYPELDPDVNKILVETNRFYITTGNVIDALFKNFSGELDKLKNVDSTRIKKIFNDNASLIAEKKMIIAAAIDEGFEVSKSELDSVMQQQYEKVGGKEKFEKYMESRNIPIGYILEDYKNSLLIQKLLKSLVKDSIKISENEVQEKLMQVKSVTVRHILLKTVGLNDTQKKQKRNKLERILQQAKSGESFTKLAQKHSEDTGSAKNGGLMKNIKPGDMVQPFDNISFSLAIGEISNIFETQFGYHIVTVIDRKKEDRSFNEIKEELRESQQKRLLPKIVKSLKEEYGFKEIKI